MKNVLVIAVLSLLPLTGCSTKSEGPAEKIGRGLDEILEGGTEMQEKYGSPSYRENQGARPDGPVDGLSNDEYRDSRHDLDSDDWWNERERRERTEREREYDRDRSDRW